MQARLVCRLADAIGVCVELIPVDGVAHAKAYVPIDRSILQTLGSDQLDEIQP